MVGGEVAGKNSAGTTRGSPYTSHTKPKEDPEKLMEPRGVGAAGDGGSLESTMQMLDHAIGFRVVGRRLVAC